MQTGSTPIPGAVGRLMVSTSPTLILAMSPRPAPAESWRGCTPDGVAALPQDRLAGAQVWRGCTEVQGMQQQLLLLLVAVAWGIPVAATER